MTYFVAILILAAFVGGIAFYKHRAKLKAAAIAEAEQIKNEIASKL